MRTAIRICWSTRALVLAVGMGVTGCGAGVPPTVGSPNLTDAAAVAGPTPAGTVGPRSHETIAGYLRAAHIAEVPVHRGDPGAPTIELPTPPGWRRADGKTPDWAYDAIVFTDPAAAADPPTVIAQLTKLTGPVDKAKLFELAPGELKNLPGFDAMGSSGRPTTLSGFAAFQYGGTYVEDGVTRLVAQKTVVIPGKVGNAVYVLQLNANGVAGLKRPLLAATSDIDAKTRITT